MTTNLFPQDILFAMDAAAQAGAIANGGVYEIKWHAVLDDSATNQNVSAQLYNTTDAAVVGAEQIMRPTISAERREVGGFAPVTGSGATKTFAIQYKTFKTGATVGIQDARIEVIRIS